MATVDTKNTPFAKCADYCGAAATLTLPDGTPSISMTSGSFAEMIKTLELGFYTIYMSSNVTDIPAPAKAIGSSLRGIVHNTYVHTKEPYGRYAYIYALVFDTTGNVYAQYVQGYKGTSGWVQLNAVKDGVLTVGETTVTEAQLKALLKLI